MAGLERGARGEGLTIARATLRVLLLRRGVARAVLHAFGGTGRCFRRFDHDA
jgi:hypothetical protein